MIRRRAKLVGALFAIVCTSFSTSAQASDKPIAPVAQLTPSDGMSGDSFGSSLALSGNTLVVGSAYAEGAGAAYIFSGSGSSWTQIAKLTPSDGVTGGQFGYALAISGNTIAVGAPMSSGGAVYVFVKPATGWQNMTETAKLTYQGDIFGYCVAFAGDGQFLLVDALFQSAAYVFDKPPTGWVNATAPTTILVPPSGSSGFGNSIATSGTTAVIGAPGTNNSSGAAYIFSLTAGVANINASATLTASDSGGILGNTLAFHGNTVLAGAQNHQDATGAAYVFVEPATGWTDMTQTAELTSGSSAQTAFGAALGLSTGAIIVGLPSGRVGTVDEFTQPSTGWANSAAPNFRFLPPIKSDNFGGILAFDGMTLAVGDYLANENEGAVDIFQPER
jgi:hypothetical protein